MQLARVTILTDSVFDSYARSFLVNQAITVSQRTGLILNVSPITSETPQDYGAQVIDLRNKNVTVIPGLIDTHVHMFLHPYSETSWTDQVTRESTAERTIRASVHARKTLMSGYTAVRDLGTEGAEDADVALKKCITTGIIPGPRLFTASRAIVATGAYSPKGELRPSEEGVDGKRGAEVADGETGCRQAVRRQVATGADWVKIYADYASRRRSAVAAPALAKRILPTFNEIELKTMIETAHSLGVKIAAHSTRSDVVRKLIDLGIDSIEHGLHVDIDTLRHLAEARDRVTWCPTLAIYGPYGEYSEGGDESRKVFEEALVLGNVRIACGGDTGTFGHGKNALEMLTMVAYGAPWQSVLSWSTLGGWEGIRGLQWEGELGRKRLAAFAAAAEKGFEAESSEIEVLEGMGEWPLGANDVPLGAIRPGFAADLVAVRGDLRHGGKEAFLDVFGAKSTDINPEVIFVMKGGKTYKLEGRELSEPL